MRLAEGAFVMEGERLLQSALDAGAAVESLYVAQDAANVASVARLISRARDSGVRVFELASGVLERVADTVTPQPVMAVVRTPAARVEDLRNASLVVVLVDVRDPGNAGAVIRAADAAGADGVVFCEGSADPYNPKTVRASAGSVLHLPIVSEGAPVDALEDLGDLGLRRLAALSRGGRTLDEVNVAEPLALVVGNEASGLPDEISEMVDETVTIPMAGGAESLNVSMAAAVICFDIARRRSNLRPMNDPLASPAWTKH